MVKLKEILEGNDRETLAQVQVRIQQYIKGGSNGDLDLSQTQLTKLPDNLKKVGGRLNLDNSKIKSLPDGLYVAGKLDLSYSDISELPTNLTVDYDVYLNETPLSRKYTESQLYQAISPKWGTVNVEASPRRGK
jgi:Leucine-rich repeat (LRR) protein